MSLVDVYNMDETGWFYHAQPDYELELGAHIVIMLWKLLELGLDIRIIYSKHKKNAIVKVGFDLS